MKHLALATGLSVSILLAACGGGQSPGVAPINPQARNDSVPHTSAADPVGFGFNGSASGISGAVTLTGGGSYDPLTASDTIPSTTSVHSAGGFRCTQTVSDGPLAGCLAGEGVRWDTVQLLQSTPFKCTLPETLRTATTGTHTVVLLADFYRAGDGDDESFTGKMIVSDTDLDPGIPGSQRLWIQAVGCGPAIVHFSS
jgi:hypothetical protein